MFRGKVDPLAAAVLTKFSEPAWFRGYGMPGAMMGYSDAL